ncbi:MAG: rane protein [Acidobacteriaceae bacterium]|nr:rane protein [Acidobacteriaceae bacterium]
MQISELEFEQLLRQVRELTARVHRLEERLGVQASTLSSQQRSESYVEPPPAPPARATPPSQPPPRQIQPALLHVSQGSSDLESRIGSHWLNRVGIAAVLIGVSFFLDYAFENNWIGPSARVVIGLFAGIAVVLWSERFRKRGYDIFSYSLKAVGIGVLYLSLWASFQVYHLLPSNLVFAAMIVVTASTCALAIAQNAEVLAIFAIAGGFATPGLLSAGENHEIVLFSYLALLDLGLLALTMMKPWRRISVLGFIGTLIYYVGWYGEFYDRTQLTSTLIFASLFFALFAAAPFLILRQNSGRSIPLALAFANCVTYFLQGYVMLNAISSTETAWFALLLATVYLLLVRIKVGASDAIAENSLRLMHLALAIGLITIAIPIRLEAHAITIGWLVESAALLWVAGRLKSDLLNAFALAALALGLVRLLFIDSFEPLTLLFNSRMAVYAVAIAVLGYAAFQNAGHENEKRRIAAAVALIALNVVALRGLSLEVTDYYARQMPITFGNYWSPAALLQRRSVLIARDFTYSALWMAYGALLMIIGFWRASAFVRWQALVLIALTTLKVFVYDTSELDRIYRILSFVVLGILLLAISFAYQRNWLKLPSTKTS